MLRVAGRAMVASLEREEIMNRLHRLWIGGADDHLASAWERPELVTNRSLLSRHRLCSGHIGPVVHESRYLKVALREGLRDICKMRADLSCPRRIVNLPLQLDSPSVFEILEDVS